jgi:hypothetical protein
MLCDETIDVITITGVRTLLTNYIKKHNLLSEDKSITIDEDLYNISPESFDAKKTYSSAEWKSISLMFAKNVLQWKSSASS